MHRPLVLMACVIQVAEGGTIASRCRPTGPEGIEFIATELSLDGKYRISLCKTAGPDGSTYYHSVRHGLGQCTFETRKATDIGISSKSEPETPERVKKFLLDRLREYCNKI